MWIGILGALQVRDGSGVELALGGAGPRALLLRLAVDTGHVVSTTTLIDDLWPGRPPRDPVAALQSVVARLRRSLDADPGLGRKVITSHPTGYRLAVPAESVDAALFERRYAEGQRALAAGDPAAAAGMLESALSLWRGAPLTDVADLPFAAAPTARLTELRLCAIESRVDAGLVLGESAAGFVADLEELCAAHPLRESAQARLMRALVAAGRRAEALTVHDRVRQAMAEELGVDPGSELRAAHLTALHDDAPVTPAVPVTAGPTDRASAGAPAAAAVDGAAREPSTRASGDPARPAADGLAPDGGVLGREGLGSDAPDSAGPDDDGLGSAGLGSAGLGREGLGGEASNSEALGSAGPGGVLDRGVRRGSGESAAGVTGDASGARGGAARSGPVTGGTRGNLPARRTSFFGREREMARVRELLGESRLVTLTGFGGVGKTRLAVEAGSELRDRFPDGVWLVELAAVTDGDGLAPAILAALGQTGSVLPGDAEDPVERIKAALVDGEPLLILDNCEHLVDAVAALSDDLLTAVNGLRLLATSREPLSINGEALCPISPLGLPPVDVYAELSPYPLADELDGRRALAGAADALIGDTAPEDAEPEIAARMTVATALEHAAVALFIDRARAARPGFTIEAGTVGAVVRICRELDGIPLAIELAAARLRSLTLGQLVEHIGSRLSVLGRGNRGSQSRHRTLRAVIDWSWDLLESAERALLRRMSVFAGGADLPALRRVCLAGGSEAEALDLVSALVDRSLVLAVEPDNSATGAGVRYTLLATVREYATQKLADAGEQDQYRDSHAQHFLELAESAEPLLRGSDQLRWLAVLDRERSNLEAALDHAISAGHIEVALRLTVARIWWWSVRGRRREAQQWAAAATEAAAHNPPPGQEQRYAICLLASAGYGGGTGRIADLHKVATLMRDTNQPAVLAASMIGHWLGVTDLDEIRRFTAETADWLLGQTDPWMRATGHLERGVIAAEFTPGGAPGAEEHLLAALEGFRSVGDRWGLVYAWWELSAVLENRGDAGDAVRALDEARRNAAELGGPELLPVPAMLLVQSGRLRARAGDFDGALAELARARTVAERTANPVALARVHHALGEVAWRRGDLAEADERHTSALALVTEIDADDRGPADGLSPQFRALAHSSLARVRGRRGDHEAARELHGRALALLADTMDAPARATILEGVAEWCLDRNAPDRAAVALGAAQALRGVQDSGDPDLRKLLEQCAHALGEHDFRISVAQGAALYQPELFALPGR